MNREIFQPNPQTPLTFIMFVGNLLGNKLSTQQYQRLVFALVRLKLFNKAKIKL